jgi:two-component sensor histidine kinase
MDAVVKSRTGFGSKLVYRIAAQLGGANVFNWDQAGVVATLRLSKKRLAN